MQLKEIVIRNFRSIDEIKLHLGTGLNVFTGPNNSGKSNILRAVALTLDEKSVKPFSWEYDYPLDRKRLTRSTISLDFQLDESRGPELTLKKYLIEYENSIIKKSKYETFAEKGFLRLFNQYIGSKESIPKNQKYFLSSSGSIKGNDEFLNKSLKQFNKLIRFVYLKSGENLSSLVERGFHEILRDVMEEKLRKQFEAAKNKRKKFHEELKGGILAELSSYIKEEISDIMPEIKDVELEPKIPEIKKIISDCEVRFRDNYLTAIENKGTGVRSTFLINLMSFIATSTSKSVVFAIEEPESFVHPEIQKKLAGVIKKISNKKNVTVLLTTHSPFLLNEIDESQIHIIQKNSLGRTIELKQTRERGGRTYVNKALEMLVGNRILPEIFEKKREIGEEVNCILLVEGYTDKKYMEMALEKNNLQKELERIHIEICEGANNACLKAILFKQLFHNELPVITILDYDANGEKIYKAMTKDFKFQGKKEVVKYDQYVKASGADVEAEDLFPGTLLKKFLKNHEGALSEKILRPENKSKRQFHYGLTETGKKEFLEWLPKNSKKSDYRNWLRLIEDIRKRYDKIKK